MTPEQQLTLAYVTAHGREAARDLELMAPEAAAALLAPLPASAIAEALRHPVPYMGARILDALPEALGAETLGLLPTGQARALLRRIAPPRRAALLAALEPQRAAVLTRALASRDGTAGALAEADVLTVSAASSVAQALQRLRGDPARASYYVYVLESEAKLIGVTNVKALVASPGASLLADVCKRIVVTLPSEAGLQELLQNPHWRDFHILPVVGRDGTFVGALHQRVLHDLATRGSGGDERLSAALLQLWELYAVAGVNLITGLVAGVDAMATAVSAPPSGAATAHEEEASE